MKIIQRFICTLTLALLLMPFGGMSVAYAALQAFSPVRRSGECQHGIRT